MKFPILLPNIFNHPFTYESDIKLDIGDYVEVPFGKSKMTGIVWNEFEKKSNKNFKVKKIIKKLNLPKLNKNFIQFLNSFSDYNLIPKGMSLKLLLLSSNAIEKVDLKKLEEFEKLQNPLNFELNDEQHKSLKEINKLNDRFRVHVLQGTTGSGKTIVYFYALKEILSNNNQGLILLPEIGLTNQFEKKFYEFFGFKPAIWHSGISKKKKKQFGMVLQQERLKLLLVQGHPCFCLLKI